jgi:hypothetical protein
MPDFFLTTSCKGAYLRIGDKLYPDDWMSSPSGRFQLKFTIQRGLCLYRFEKGNPDGILMYRWHMFISPGCDFCSSNEHLEMRPPGYISLMCGSIEVDKEMHRRLPDPYDFTILSSRFDLETLNGWCTLQDDGNFVFYPEQNPSAETAYWASNTGTSQAVMAHSLIPGTLNLEIDGELSAVSDKTLVNNSGIKIGVTDGSTAVTVKPGEHIGVVTLVGQLAVQSVLCDVSPGVGGSGSEPHSDTPPGPNYHYGPDDKFINVNYSASAIPGEPGRWIIS